MSAVVGGLAAGLPGGRRARGGHVAAAVVYIRGEGK